MGGAADEAGTAPGIGVTIGTRRCVGPTAGGFVHVVAAGDVPPAGPTTGAGVLVVVAVLPDAGVLPDTGVATGGAATAVPPTAGCAAAG